MYAMALLCLDHDHDDLPSVSIHRILLQQYEEQLLLQSPEIDQSLRDPGLLSQCAVYLEWIKTLPVSVQSQILPLSSLLSSEVIGEVAEPFSVPQLTARLRHYVPNELQIVDPFYGLRHKIFPITAILSPQQRPIAFLHMLTQSERELTRKRQLKEMVYRWNYPSVPMFRLNAQEVEEGEEIKKIVEELQLERWTQIE